MAKPKTFPRLTREAADPTTAPARLDYLSRHHDPTVRRLALANPALPGSRLAEALRLGYPPAWGNPAALWALLEMPPADAQEGSVRAVTELARCRTRTAAVEPPHAVTETMASLLRPHLLAAWEECSVGGRMLYWAYRVGTVGYSHDSLDIDYVERFAWSGTTDPDRRRAMLDTPTGSALSAYAALAEPSFAMGIANHISTRVSGTVNIGAGTIRISSGRTDDVADLLRAAMPVPMWLDELTPSAPVAP